MPNNIVIKKNGKFEIVPSDEELARQSGKADMVKVKSKLTDEDTRAILERILLRLEALERPTT